MSDYDLAENHIGAPFSARADPAGTGSTALLGRAWVSYRVDNFQA